MKFGLNWLFIATFGAAVIAAAWQLGPLSAYLATIIVIPVLVAAFCRVELRKASSTSIVIVVIASIVTSGILSVLGVGVFLFNHEGSNQPVAAILASFVFGSLGGLFLAMFPFGVYCVIAPFLETFFESDEVERLND